MKKKKVAKIMAVTMACAMLVNSVPVSAASMTKTLNWAGYGVTITNSWSVPYVYDNKNILVVYPGSNKSGSLLESRTVGPTPAVATNTIINSETKSAYAKYYTLDAGVIVSSYTCTKNKGSNL